MSKIRELRNNPENSFNLVDMFSNLYPYGKTKYIDLIIKLMHSNIHDMYVSGNDTGKICQAIISNIKLRFPNVNDEYIHSCSTFDLILILKVTELQEKGVWNIFNDFIQYNERNLIIENNLTVYKTFEQIRNSVAVAELREYSKDMEKQVIELYNENDWLIIRPLTYSASKKYGANTKWCTSSDKDRSYFMKYTRKGILIYCMNKKTGMKAAAHKDLSTGEVSFWDQVDTSIDATMSELSDEALLVVKNEFRTNHNPNSHYLSKEDFEKEYGSSMGKKFITYYPYHLNTLEHQLRGEHFAEPQPIGIELGEVPANGEMEEDSEEGDDEEVMDEIPVDEGWDDDNLAQAPQEMLPL